MNLVSPLFASAPSFVSEADLCAWIGAAPPGDRLEYHRGFLARDLDPEMGLASPVLRRQLKQVARRALWAESHGLIFLVQRRHGEGAFGYWAIARPKPRRTSVPLASIWTAPVPREFDEILTFPPNAPQPPRRQS